MLSEISHILRVRKEAIEMILWKGFLYFGFAKLYFKKIVLDTKNDLNDGINKTLNKSNHCNIK